MDISDKINDPVIVELLTQISVVSAELDIPFFVIGATARDLVLWCGFGIRPGRATRDIDIGISASSREQYDQLKNALAATGKFEPEGDNQRMSFQGGIKVDMVPFGQIVDEDKKIAWRRDQGRGDAAGAIHYPEEPWREPTITYFQHDGIVLSKRIPSRVERGDCLYQIGSAVPPG